MPYSTLSTRLSYINLLVLLNTALSLTLKWLVSGALNKIGYKSPPSELDELELLVMYAKELNELEDFGLEEELTVWLEGDDDDDEFSELSELWLMLEELEKEEDDEFRLEEESEDVNSHIAQVLIDEDDEESPRGFTM